MLAAFSSSSFKWGTWSSIRPHNGEVRSNTSGCAWYRRDFWKPVGRLTNTSFLSSTIFLIPVFCCVFELGNQNVLLTTSNTSSKVVILKALNSKMKQTIWLVRLLWRAEFSIYVTQMVIGRSAGKECCSNVSSRLWGGALRDETKNGCEGDYPTPGLSLIFLSRKRVPMQHCCTRSSFLEFSVLKWINKFCKWLWSGSTHVRFIKLKYLPEARQAAQ